MATQNKADFDALAAKVKAIPVAMVVGTLIQLYDSKSRQMIDTEELQGYDRMMLGLCPFHADERLGSFTVTPGRNRWHCFVDGFGGSGIDFEKQYFDMKYRDAVYHLARRFNLMSEADYLKFARKKADTQQVEGVVLPEDMEFADKCPKCTKKADSDVINTVYSVIPKVCPLTKKHREHLARERGLTEADMADYFSFPSARTDLAKKVFQEIVRLVCKGKFGKEPKELDAAERERIMAHKGIKRVQEQLEIVPGFYIDREQDMIKFSTYRGIGFVVRDMDGKAVGIQVRQDNVKNVPLSKEKREEREKAVREGWERYNNYSKAFYDMVDKSFAEEKSGRYVWFSSSFASTNQKKYRGGATSGCPGGVIYPKDGIEKAPLVITEGRFKAVSIDKKGNIAVYVSGVSTWASIIPAVETLKGKRKTVFAMFDADVFGNAAVHTQLREMSKALQEMGLRVDIIAWRMEYGKGIDDLMHAKGEKYKDLLKVVRFDDFEKIYDFLSGKLLQKYGAKSQKALQGLDRTWYAIDMQIGMEDALGLPKEKSN